MKATVHAIQIVKCESTTPKTCKTRSINKKFIKQIYSSLQV